MATIAAGMITTLFDELLTAVHAKLTHVHPPVGMRIFAALFDWDVFIDNFAALRAAADGCVGVSVIQIRARIRGHLYYVELVEVLSVSTELGTKT